jgi:hypothetical protein
VFGRAVLIHGGLGPGIDDVEVEPLLRTGCYTISISPPLVSAFWILHGKNWSSSTACLFTRKKKKNHPRCCRCPHRAFPPSSHALYPTVVPLDAQGCRWGGGHLRGDGSESEEEHTHAHDAEQQLSSFRLAASATARR